MEQTLGASNEDLLETPLQGGRSLTTAERRSLDLSRRIPGCGSDLEPARRPGVPRDRAPDIGPETLYPPIPRQIPRITIFKSTEHGRLTPVFGTSCPPSGLSGRMRRVAYHYSEGRMLRWLTLMAADRVNMIEDIVADLAHGRVPEHPEGDGPARGGALQPGRSREEGGHRCRRHRARRRLPPGAARLMMI